MLGGWRSGTNQINKTRWPSSRRGMGACTGVLARAPSLDRWAHNERALELSRLVGALAPRAPIGIYGSSPPRRMRYRGVCASATTSRVFVLLARDLVYSHAHTHRIVRQIERGPSSSSRTWIFHTHGRTDSAYSNGRTARGDQGVPAGCRLHGRREAFAAIVPGCYAPSFRCTGRARCRFDRSWLSHQYGGRGTQ